MCSNHGAIDDRSCAVDVQLQRFENVRPQAAPRPVRESIVNSLPRPEALGQVSPRDASLGAIQYSIDETSVARFGSSTPIGHDLLQPFPLLVAQRMPVHAQARAPSALQGNFSARRPLVHVSRCCPKEIRPHAAS